MQLAAPVYQRSRINEWENYSPVDRKRTMTMASTVVYRPQWPGCVLPSVSRSLLPRFRPSNQFSLIISYIHNTILVYFLLPRMLPYMLHSMILLTLPYGLNL